MRMKALFLAAALAALHSSPAIAADYTDQLWGTVSVEWLQPALSGDDPQRVNRARRHCGQWASYITNEHERQQLYVRCLRAELPETHYRIIDLTDERAVQNRYPPAADRSKIEFPYVGQ